MTSSYFSIYNWFAEQSLYINVGYWKNSPKTLDEACQAMTKLLGEEAQIGIGDCVLDVGFGFADQDLFWMDYFSPRRIVGLNINPAQVEVARRRAVDHKVENRIELQVGSATAIPFTTESFDKVVALECTFHFVTREKFFQEAYRVLRPGGKIATADPLPMANRTLHDLAIVSLLLFYAFRLFIPHPKENWYPYDIYAKKLEKAGFENIRITSIREHIYLPFRHYLARRLHDPEIVQRVNLFHRLGWLLATKIPPRYVSESFDYVIAVADKPKH